MKNENTDSISTKIAIVETNQNNLKDGLHRLEETLKEHSIDTKSNHNQLSSAVLEVKSILQELTLSVTKQASNQEADHNAIIELTLKQNQMNTTFDERLNYLEDENLKNKQTIKILGMIASFFGATTITGLVGLITLFKR